MTFEVSVLVNTSLLIDGYSSWSESFIA